MFVHLYIPSRADLLGCTRWSKRTVCSARALLSVICTSPSNFYCRCYSPRCILTYSPQDISPKKKRLLKLVELFSVHIWPKQKATAAQNVVYKWRKTLSSLPDAFNLQLQKFGHAQKAKFPPPPPGHVVDIIQRLLQGIYAFFFSLFDWIRRVLIRVWLDSLKKWWCHGW